MAYERDIPITVPIGGPESTPMLKKLFQIPRSCGPQRSDIEAGPNEGATEPKHPERRRRTINEVILKLPAMVSENDDYSQKPTKMRVHILSARERILLV